MLVPMLVALPATFAILAVAIAAAAACPTFSLTLVPLLIGNVSSEPRIALAIEHLSVLRTHQHVMVLHCVLLLLLLPHPSLELVQ